MLDIVQPSKSRGSPPQTTGDYSTSITNKVGDNIGQLTAQADHASLEGIHLRLTPMLGRTLAIGEAGISDLQSAFRVLEVRCQLNRVKSDSIEQRTHIRRGQKRKQLNSKRWRTLFKEGFMREVARVRRMKKQGW